MSTDCSNGKKRRTVRALALTVISVLALAASPTALAGERGGPGAPSVRTSYVSYLILTLPGRFASWSD
jgi:hypothetical protein